MRDMKMTQNNVQIHEAVRERYGRLAVEASDAGCLSLIHI